MDLIGLGLEFQGQMLSLADEFDQIERKFGDLIQRKRIRQFPGSHPEMPAGSRVGQTIHFLERVTEVGINLKGGIVGDVFLQKAIAAIHRAV